jgi:hypothetical protein
MHAMARISTYVLSAFALLAAMFWAPLDSYRVGAWPKLEPVSEVNRTLKGDRLSVLPRSIVRTTPATAPVEPAPRERKPRLQLLSGCEPSFSPITMPTMAHIAGRCIG